MLITKRTVQERYQNQVVPISEHSAEQHEMTFHVDSQDDSEQAHAWFYSRGNQSLNSEQKMYTSQEDNHDSMGSGSGQANYNLFNSQPTSDYSNHA